MSNLPADDLNELDKWVAEICEQTGIPDFEKTDRNIEILRHLKKTSEMVKKDLEIVDEDAIVKKKAYDDYVVRIQKWLETLNISPSMLSAEGQSCLNSLSSLACELAVPYGCTSSDFIRAIYEVEEEHRKVAEELEVEKKRTTDLLKLSEEVSKDIVDVKRITEQAEKLTNCQSEDLKKSKARREFNDTKIKQYQSEIARMEKMLTKAGFEQSLTKEYITKSLEEVAITKKQLETAKETFSHYSELPPDMSRARIKVEEARQELSELMKGLAETYADAAV